MLTEPHMGTLEPRSLFFGQADRAPSEAYKYRSINAPNSPADANAVADTGDHPSGSSSGGGAKTPSTPEPAEEGKSKAEDGSPELDIYGRRFDRSFRTDEEAKEPVADKYCDTVATDVGSGDDQHPRIDGRTINADRVACAEWRAEASEAAAREAATAVVTAACETRAAKAEAERLRAEGVELSRWREAVLNLRDVLEITQREGQEVGDDGREDDGRCFLW